MDEYAKRDIERRANLLLRKAGVAGPVIPLAQLHQACRVTVEEISFSRRHRILAAIKRRVVEPARRLARWIAIYAREEDTILLNRDVEPRSRRWAHAHDLGHALLEHASQTFFSEDQFSHLQDPDNLLDAVNWSIKEEAEANYFASYILFPRDDWEQFNRACIVSAEQARHLADAFAVSLSAAFRELVLRSPQACALAVLPRRSPSPHGSMYCLALIGSPGWNEIVDPAEREPILSELLTIRGYRGSLPEILQIPLRGGRWGRAKIDVTLSPYALFALLSLS